MPLLSTMSTNKLMRKKWNVGCEGDIAVYYTIKLCGVSNQKTKAEFHLEPRTFEVILYPGHCLITQRSACLTH